MDLCKPNYVGENITDKSLNTQEVFQRTSSIRKVYNYNGKMYTDTPEQLFNKFNSLSTSSPNDATSWSIQLCSCYLSVLTVDLNDYITSDENFKMPNLTTLTTEALQLEALRGICQKSSVSFRSLSKQKDKIISIIKHLRGVCL